MDRKFIATVTISSLAMFGLTWAYAGGARYYPDCGWARTFGAAPILKGQPGYRPELDGDNDGIACEPIPAGGGYHGWRRGRWRR